MTKRRERRDEMTDNFLGRAISSFLGGSISSAGTGPADDWCGGQPPDPGWCGGVEPPQDWCGGSVQPRQLLEQAARAKRR